MMPADFEQEARQLAADLGVAIEQAREIVAVAHGDGCIQQIGPEADKAPG